MCAHCGTPWPWDGVLVLEWREPMPRRRHVLIRADKQDSRQGCPLASSQDSPSAARGRRRQRQQQPEAWKGMKVVKDGTGSMG